MTRKELLGQAFVVEGARGLTARQMRDLVGANWRRRLRELVNDGWQFREDPARHGRARVFRWVLIYEPLACGDTCQVQRDPALFDPDPPRPSSALEAA